MGIKRFILAVFHHERLQGSIYVFLFATAMLIGNWVCGKQWVLGFFLGSVVFAIFTFAFLWLIGDIEFGKVGEVIAAVLVTGVAFVVAIVASMPALVLLAIVSLFFKDREYLFGLLALIGLLAYLGLCRLVLWLGASTFGLVQVLVDEVRKRWKARKFAKVTLVAKVPSINH